MQAVKLSFDYSTWLICKCTLNLFLFCNTIVGKWDHLAPWQTLCEVYMIVKFASSNMKPHLNQQATLDTPAYTKPY